MHLKNDLSAVQIDRGAERRGSSYYPNMLFTLDKDDFQNTSCLYAGFNKFRHDNLRVQKVNFFNFFLKFDSKLVVLVVDCCQINFFYCR